MLHRLSELILALGLAIPLAPAALATDCPPFDPAQADRYSRQPDGSCAGFTNNEDVSGAVGLVSFTIGNLTQATGSAVTLWVPRPAPGRHARLSLKAHGSSYQANDLRREDDRGWDIYRNVPLPQSARGNLWAIAKDSDDRYVPVFYAPGDYHFTLRATNPTRFPRLAIRCNGREVWSGQLGSFQTGPRTFTWNGRNTAADRCQLSYQVDIEQVGSRAPERRNGTVNFWHNPAWFRQ